MLVGLLVFGIANHDTESQVEAMRDQLDAITARLDATQTAIRPWVSAKLAIASDLTFDDKGAHLRLKYDLANSGLSPAFNVIAAPSLVARISDAPPLNPARELEARCGNVVRLVSRALQSSEIMSWDYAIFPATQFTEEESATLKFSKPADRFAGPTLVVSCIDYRAGPATDHHQTGSVFLLRRRSRDAPGVTVDVDLNRQETIPASELSLSPATQGTYAH